MVDVTILI